MNCTRHAALTIPDARNATPVLLPFFRKTELGREPLTDVTQAGLQVFSPKGDLLAGYPAVSGEQSHQWVVTLPAGALRAYVNQQLEAALVFTRGGQTRYQRFDLIVK